MHVRIEIYEENQQWPIPQKDYQAKLCLAKSYQQFERGREFYLKPK